VNGNPGDTETDTVTASGTDDDGDAVSDDDDATVTIVAVSLGLTKNSTTTSVTSIGQVVPYDYVISNTGTVALTGVTLGDDNTDSTPVCAATTIAPGAWISCTAQHTVTTAEFNTGGNLTNVATADSNETGPVQATLDIPIVRIFDPPFGIKDYDDSGLPALRWTMVWINDSDATDMLAEIRDPIPAGTTYLDGLVCTATGDSTTTSCDFDVPTNSIVWTGTIDADSGATNAANANHEVIITFRVTIPDSMTFAENIAVIDADTNGDGIIAGAGETAVANAQAAWIRSSLPRVPETGFAPDLVTATPTQSREKEYSSYSDVWLEIPSLGIKTNIVGVPVVEEEWDVTWLHDQAGWLSGTAFPSYAGNSVVTAHVYLPSGLPGPFVDLEQMDWDDTIIVHAFGYRYIYKVRSNQIIDPENSRATRHEEYSWLTLLTCKGYNESRDAYNFRVMVRAVLVEVRPDLYH